MTLSCALFVLNSVHFSCSLTAWLPAEVDIVLGEPGEGVLDIDITAATCKGDLCTIHRRDEERPPHFR